MRRPWLPCFLLLALAAPPLAAQDLSDEELLELFLRQREAFQATREGDLGQTRGLELITVDDLTTDPELASEAPQESAAPASDAPEVQDDLASLPDPTGPTEGEAAGLDTGGDVTIAADTTATLTEPVGSDVVDATVVAAAAPSEPGEVVFGRLAPELQVNVRVTFAFDSAVLVQDQIAKLQQLCGVMEDSGIGLFRIVGHTDAAGSDEYNERLSLLRAQEVRRWFVNDCGLAPERLEAVGLGERFLFDESDPRASDNRRVEFQALS
jgi:outer membrane protein OmpA-like peptidoglycan-associated protein